MTDIRQEKVTLHAAVVIPSVVYFVSNIYLFLDAK